jgi:hypothetical protein
VRGYLDLLSIDGETCFDRNAPKEHRESLQSEVYVFALRLHILKHHRISRSHTMRELKLHDKVRALSSGGRMIASGRR